MGGYRRPLPRIEGNPESARPHARFSAEDADRHPVSLLRDLNVRVTNGHVLEGVDRDHQGEGAIGRRDGLDVTLTQLDLVCGDQRRCARYQGDVEEVPRRDDGPGRKGDRVIGIDLEGAWFLAAHLGTLGNRGPLGERAPGQKAVSSHHRAIGSTQYAHASGWGCVSGSLADEGQCRGGYEQKPGTTHDHYERSSSINLNPVVAIDRATSGARGLVCCFVPMNSRIRGSPPCEAGWVFRQMVAVFFPWREQRTYGRDARPGQRQKWEDQPWNIGRKRSRGSANSRWSSRLKTPVWGPRWHLPPGCRLRAISTVERRLRRRLPPATALFLHEHDGWPLFFQGASLLGTRELSKPSYADLTRAAFAAYETPIPEVGPPSRPEGRAEAMIPFGMDPKARPSSPSTPRSSAPTARWRSSFG